MAGFKSFEQLDLLEPYEDKFFDILFEQHEHTTYKTFSSFFHSMLPRMVVKDSYIVRLVALLHETPDTEQMFAETIKDGIDMLIRSQ